MAAAAAWWHARVVSAPGITCKKITALPRRPGFLAVCFFPLFSIMEIKYFSQQQII